MPEKARRPTERARQLRREASPAERRLWLRLSRRQLAGFRFNRQMPVGPFICDFLCRSAGLAIELDGYSHDVDGMRDASRDTVIADHGVQVLRFSNRDVFENIEGVLIAIEQALIRRVEMNSGPPPAPPASGRGE